MSLSNSALTDGYDDPEDTPLIEEAPPQPHEGQDEPGTTQLTQPSDAAEKNVQIPPKLVEDVQGNVELLRPVARSMAAINLHNLFVRVQHPATNAKDRLDFQQLLNKMAGLTEVKGEGASAGHGFSITINIPGSDKGVTVDGTAKRISDEVGS